jgi:hypothetical protein
MGVKFVAIAQRPSRHAPVPRPGGNGCTGPSRTIPSTAGATAVGAEEPSAGQLSIEGTDPLSHERVADEATRDRSGPSPPVSASQPALSNGPRRSTAAYEWPYRSDRFPRQRACSGADRAVLSSRARRGCCLSSPETSSSLRREQYGQPRRRRRRTAMPAPPRRHPRAHEGRAKAA